MPLTDSTRVAVTALHQHPVSGVARLYPFGEYDRSYGQKRRGRETGQGEDRTEARHVGHIDRERHAHDDRRDEHLIEKHAHLLHVAGRAGDDGTGGVGVVETKIERLQLRVNLAAQLHHEALLHEDVHRHRVGVVVPGAQGGTGQDAARDQREHLHGQPVGRRIGQEDDVRHRHHRRTVGPGPGRHMPHLVDAHAGGGQAGDAEA